MMTVQETLGRVLEVLPASDCSYEEWLNIGMILKDAGFSSSAWDSWSRADVRYRDGECARKWRGFGRNAGGQSVTAGTAVEYCRRRGLWETGGYTDIGDDAGWDDAIPDSSPRPSGQVIRPEYLAPAVIREPVAWKPCDDMINYLKALFLDDEGVSYCVRSNEYTRRDGTKVLRPVMAGITEKAGDLIDKLRKERMKDSPDIAWVIGDWNRDGGAWVRVNPMKNASGDDTSVSSYRHALVECDEKTAEEQLAVIRKLELPCAAIVHSGGKSVHAVVKIQADTEQEYQKRVDFLFEICAKNGLPLDRQNRNPSRYSRLPGVTRGGRRQFLIDTDCGRQSWQDWHDWIEEQQDDLPDIEAADGFIDSPPPLAPCIIEGVLRQGHKMLLSGPSKAGKSFLLMELAMAVAEGRDWIGWKCSQGKVLYINLELDAASCKNRFADMYKVKGWPHTQGMLDVWNLRGHATPIGALAPKLIRRAKDGRYAMIIIDPIYKVISGDENAADQMAKFCNFFDMIGTACKCAMVYCHHHSKGEQGQKKAMDRASGSGVFARDPDALLDMIRLDIDDVRKNAIVQRKACTALGEELDKRYAGWRATISRDDALVLDKLCAAVSDLICQSEIDRIVSAAKQAAEGATAWRIDGIFREFPSCEPHDVWFSWPVHEVDETGMLSDVLAEGQQEPKRAKAEKRRQERNENEALVSELTLEFSELEDGGECQAKDLAEKMNMTEKSLLTLLRRQGKKIGLKLEGRTVRAINEN